GCEDANVAAAATEVPAQPLGDFRRRRRRGFVQETLARHDEARSAEATLQSVVGDERRLHGIEWTVRAERLNRGDLVALNVDRQERAGVDSLAVQQDGAGSTASSVTNAFGPGEAPD